MESNNIAFILRIEAHMLKRSLMRNLKSLFYFAAISAVTAIIGVLSIAMPANAAAPTVVSTSPANGATNVSLITPITATFDVAMDQTTIWTNFTVVDDLGVTLPSMGVNYNDLTKTASYSSLQGLSYNRTYTATLSTGVTDALGNALAAPYSWTFSAPVLIDPVAPSVVSTNPASGASNVPLSSYAQLTVTFDKEVTTSTVTSIGSFTMTDDLGSVFTPMSKSYADKTATFSFTNPINANRTYTASISGVENLAGTAMPSPYTWSFSAVTINDPIPPTIISAVPSNGLTNIPTSLSSISFTFDKDIIPSSLTASSVTISDPSNNHPSTMGMQVLGRTITYWIVSELSTSTVYTVNVSNIQSLAGVTMDPFTWSFTTSDIATTAPTDSTPPQVLSVTPANQGRNIATNTTAIRATFTTARPLMASSVNASNFTIKDNFNVPLVPSSVELINSAAIFTPSTPLLPDRTYTAMINGFQTAVGAIMTTPYIWSFSTVNAIPPTVASTTPANGATGLSAAFMGGQMTITFDQYMDYYESFDYRNYTIIDDLGYQIMPNSMWVSGKTVGFNSYTLNPNRTYTVTVAAIKNASGVRMLAPYSFTFSSAVIADPGAPVVILTDPLDAANKTTAVTRISATFDKDLLAGSVATSTFAISDNLGAIYFPSSATYGARVATAFLPALPANRTYTVSVSGTRNIVGTLMTAPHVWLFSTAAAMGAPAGLVATSTQTTAGISWTASTGGIAPITYSISRNGALIGTTTGTVFNDTGLTASTSYSYVITASDSNLPIPQTASSSVLNVTTLESLTKMIAVTLNAGWNLVTLPGQHVTSTGTPINHTAESFGKLVGADMITAWTSAGQKYNSHIVGFPLNDFSLANGMGFFVHRATSTVVNLDTMAYVPVAPTITSGWNLLGWTSTSPISANTFGLSITGSDLITKWNSATQSWSSHIVNFPLNDFIINQGDGIFVHRP